MASKAGLRELTFPAPRGIWEFDTITMREVDGEDEMSAASAAAIKNKQYGREDWSPMLELLRISIVRIGRRKMPGGEIVQTPVGGAAPFDELDGWRSKARNAAMRFYNEMNGLDEVDLKACVAAATASQAKTQTPDEASTVAPSGG